MKFLLNLGASISGRVRLKSLLNLGAGISGRVRLKSLLNLGAGISGYCWNHLIPITRTEIKEEMRFC